MHEKVQKLLEAAFARQSEEQPGTPQHAYITGKIAAYGEVLQLLKEDTSLAWLSQALNEGKGVYKP